MRHSQLFIDGVELVMDDLALPVNQFELGKDGFIRDMKHFLRVIDEVERLTDGFIPTVDGFERVMYDLKRFVEGFEFAMGDCKRLMDGFELGM